MLKIRANLLYLSQSRHLHWGWQTLPFPNHAINIWLTCSKTGILTFIKFDNRLMIINQLVGFRFVIHHAGMLRSDRNLVEKMFSEGNL